MREASEHRAASRLDRFGLAKRGGFRPHRGDHLGERVRADPERRDLTGYAEGVEQCVEARGQGRLIIPAPPQRGGQRALAFSRRAGVVRERLGQRTQEAAPYGTPWTAPREWRAAVENQAGSTTGASLGSGNLVIHTDVKTCWRLSAASSPRHRGRPSVSPEMASRSSGSMNGSFSRPRHQAAKASSRALMPVWNQRSSGVWRASAPSRKTVRSTRSRSE